MNKLPKLEFAACVVVNRQAHSLGISLERTAAVACCIFILHLEDAAARTRYLNYKGRNAILTEKLAQKRKKNPTPRTEQLIFLLTQTAAHMKVAQTSGGWN